jgi:hypothetical protein
VFHQDQARCEYVADRIVRALRDIHVGQFYFAGMSAWMATSWMGEIEDLEVRARARILVDALDTIALAAQRAALAPAPQTRSLRRRPAVRAL